MNFIDADKLQELASPLLKSGYGEYLLQILQEQTGVPNSANEIL